MQYYPQVPKWWYGISSVIAFAFICATVKIIPTHLPIWAAIVGILIAFSLAIPITALQAISNQPAPTPVMYELIGGYMLPGQPIANAMFKTIVNTITSQICNFAGTMKLGHYMKIPPHTMFSIQIVAIIITCIWVTVIQDWMLNNIKDICTPHQKQSFICPGSTVFATSSVIFGAVGPRRLFSPGAP
jgi:OPT family oligopeptide transporter